MVQLKSIFNNMGYPTVYIDNAIGKFLDNKYRGMLKQNKLV